MTIYMKHSKLGNAHFPDEQQAELEAQGWVRWPRTPEQKAAKPVAEKPKQVVDEPKAEPFSRTTLLEIAGDRGIKVDGRWSNQRLKDEIEKA